MTSLAITIKPKEKNKDLILVEMDANKLEKLAADLGFFSADFLSSLERSFADIKAGRVKKISSLKSLRK